MIVPTRHDARICQLMAEALWQAATSESDIAWSSDPAYKAIERAFIASLREVYGLSALMAGRVRGLFAEYGPDDSLMGTTARGVESYVQFALDPSNRGARF